MKREFQKDLELFKHFLLLLNNTSPIRNVELMWHEEGEELDPLKAKFKSRVGTGDALVQLLPEFAEFAGHARAARRNLHLHQPGDAQPQPSAPLVGGDGGKHSCQGPPGDQARHAHRHQ